MKQWMVKLLANLTSPGRYSPIAESLVINRCRESGCRIGYVLNKVTVQWPQSSACFTYIDRIGAIQDSVKFNWRLYCHYL